MFQVFFHDVLRRCSKDKSPFEFFLPVWINQAHAADQAKWQQELLRSVKLIAARAFEVTDEDEALRSLLRLELGMGKDQGWHATEVEKQVMDETPAVVYYRMFHDVPRCSIASLELCIVCAGNLGGVPTPDQPDDRGDDEARCFEKCRHRHLWGAVQLLAHLPMAGRHPAQAPRPGWHQAEQLREGWELQALNSGRFMMFHAGKGSFFWNGFQDSIDSIRFQRYSDIPDISRYSGCARLDNLFHTLPPSKLPHLARSHRSSVDVQAQRSMPRHRRLAGSLHRVARRQVLSLAGGVSAALRRWEFPPLGDVVAAIQHPTTRGPSVSGHTGLTGNPDVPDDGHWGGDRRCANHPEGRTLMPPTRWILNIVQRWT